MVQSFLVKRLHEPMPGLLSVRRTLGDRRLIWWGGHGLAIGCLLIGLMLAMSSSDLAASHEIKDRARIYTRAVEFDYSVWMGGALWQKYLDFSLGVSRFLSLVTEREVIIEYIAREVVIQELEWQVRQVYADPAVGDPAAASADLRRQLDEHIRRKNELAPVAESILQQQINSVVDQINLDLGGQALPPVLYQITPLPKALIISPRDTIRQDADISLSPDLPLERQVEIETRVDKAFNVSSLVVNIGGVGVYPTMVIASSDLDWLSEVVSHEWVHNYLTLRPLGMRYMESPEMRIINETVANIAGKEIGRMVLERYYPELGAPAPSGTQVGQAAPAQAVEPPPFNFTSEMHTTRVTVDELLAQGKIEAAEAYMEARRKIFWENGYTGLRKLNQAYFAFHGAYADSPLGAAGEDPGMNPREELENAPLDP